MRDALRALTVRGRAFLAAGGTAFVCAFFLVPFLWLLSAAFDEKASAYIQWPVAPTIECRSPA